VISQHTSSINPKDFFMFQKSLETFSAVTLNEVLAFVIPFVLAVLIDLKSHKKGVVISMKDAAVWSGIWIICAMCFAGYVWMARGLPSASLYFTGYVLEKALAIDNLFAFYLIFKSFGLTHGENQSHQHRILFWRRGRSS
jgi:tellurite resistance protein TerC